MSDYLYNLVRPGLRTVVTPKILTVKLTLSEFRYLVRAVDRDHDDLGDQYHGGDRSVLNERQMAARVAEVLDRVHQEQEVPF